MRIDSSIGTENDNSFLELWHLDSNWSTLHESQAYRKAMRWIDMYA